MGRAGAVTGPAATTRGGAAVPASPTEPHVWHSPQRPTHFDVCQPHSEQRYAAFAVFAFAMA
ncbi:hypothetical protein Arub01_40450 [Actinomadura rubrobrunea]|uniref:Uncharacterized protein n=1 Tax=Actinomadura rubrobrunea TaxID=115335 RepID=A0A9W6PZ37_9ACTN|nr:hypothetical protein Arub01_40450 [Actinomadura rubrobrunea]